MGTLRLQLPAGASAAATLDLDRSAVAGGYDNMPGLTRTAIVDGELRIDRDTSDSGYLLAPLDIPKHGRLLGSTSTLIERAEPYNLTVELARGKVNQVRNQTADWRSMGMVVGDGLEARIREAGKAVGRAATCYPEPESAGLALAALSEGYGVADELVRDYMQQIFRARHSRQPKLDTLLGTRINGSVPPTAQASIAAAMNSVCLPIAWRSVEPTESNYRWEPTDTALAWAERNNLRVAAGPLIDFSGRGLPEWLWLWEGDLQSLASFMCDYVETAVGRYRGRIRRWQLSAGANIAGLLKLGEDDLLWLTARLAEAAWQVDPDLELAIGIAQPWGDYMGRKESTYSPFIFADTLIRAGLKLAALDVEWFMGVSPRGSYCRDILDASRLLDLYALLSVQLQVSVASPAIKGDDALADPLQFSTGGHYGAGHSPEGQEAWAEQFINLALSKPFVRSVYWAQLTDGEEHPLPNCGLLDSAGRPRPVLDALKRIRTEHLR